MAFLDYTGLQYFYTQLKKKFGTVKTVNGALPDATGNVKLTVESVKSVNSVFPDIAGNIALNGLVKSVNAVSPDMAGNVSLSLVKAVNGIQPDAAGNIAVGTIADMRNYLPLAGGTMTGALLLSGTPTVSLNPATKDYVDSAISGIGVGSTVIIVAGTINNGGTIPLPSGYTRNQCKYAVWPTAFSIYTYASDTATPNISVNQTTGKVVFGGNYMSDSHGGSVDSAAYLLVGVK